MSRRTKRRPGYSVAGTYDSMREGYRVGNGFLHAILRQGQVHTAHGIGRFMQEVIRKAKRLGQVVDFRIDAGYTDGETLDALTDESLRFIGRLKSDAVRERMAEPYLWRPAGRPPKGGYEKVIELGLYQAESWRHAQRVLLVIIDRPDSKTGQLNLLPDHFFLVVGWKEAELRLLRQPPQPHYSTCHGHGVAAIVGNCGCIASSIFEAVKRFTCF